MDAEELEGLARREIQALAKRNNVRANAKTSYIIKQLLKKHKGSVPPLAPPSAGESRTSPHKNSPLRNGSDAGRASCSPRQNTSGSQVVPANSQPIEGAMNAGTTVVRSPAPVILREALYGVAGPSIVPHTSASQRQPAQTEGRIDASGRRIDRALSPKAAPGTPNNAPEGPTAPDNTASSIKPDLAGVARKRALKRTRRVIKDEPRSDEFNDIPAEETWRATIRARMKYVRVWRDAVEDVPAGDVTPFPPIVPIDEEEAAVLNQQRERGRLRRAWEEASGGADGDEEREMYVPLLRAPEKEHYPNTETNHPQSRRT
ncbi:hypothetical protein BDW22DRAFT_1428265 [Trametopsis cervina]|nr:hypothetical protein BDW22DRAFT_1428265 [Trametopsis cervina]